MLFPFKNQCFFVSLYPELKKKTEIKKVDFCSFLAEFNVGQKRENT